MGSLTQAKTVTIKRGVGKKKHKVTFYMSDAAYDFYQKDKQAAHPIFSSLSDFPETACKLMMSFGTRNLSDVKKWVDGQ